MPELFLAADTFFDKLLLFLRQCVADAFEELNLVFYEDRVFRLVHLFGIMLVVSSVIF